MRTSARLTCTHFPLPPCSQAIFVDSRSILYPTRISVYVQELQGASQLEALSQSNCDLCGLCHSVLFHHSCSEKRFFTDHDQCLHQHHTCTIAHLGTTDCRCFTLGRCLTGYCLSPLGLHSHPHALWRKVIGGVTIVSGVLSADTWDAIRTLSCGSQFP